MDAALDSAGNGTLESQLAAPPSLVMLVTQELRKRVLRGEYAPGQRLSEVQLSRELGVSRPPLREAMRLLQQEGLLSLQPRRGTFVAPLTAEDVREIYSLRAALEALAVDLALPLSAPEQLQPLRDSVARMRRYVLDEDLPNLTQENYRFHLELIALARHTRLRRAYESLMGQLQMCMAMNLRFRDSLFGDKEDVIRRHEVLIGLLEKGDPAAVKQALITHGDRTFLSDLEHILGSEDELVPSQPDH